MLSTLEGALFLGNGKRGLDILALMLEFIWQKLIER
jgi:hypothetical protein